MPEPRDIISIIGNTITLGEDIEWTAGKTHYLSIRSRNAAEFGPIIVTAGTGSRDVVVDSTSLASVENSTGLTLDDVLNFDPNLGDLTSYVFGPDAGTGPRRFLVTKCDPNGIDSVSLSLVADDPQVHAADQGTPPSTDASAGFTPTGPALTGFAVSEVRESGSTIMVEATWNAAATTVTTYVVQFSYDNTSWQTGYDGTGTLGTFQVNSGTTYFRAAAYNATSRGDWATLQLTFGTAATMPDPVDDSTFTWSADYSGGVLQTDWTAPARATSYTWRLMTESVRGSWVFDTQRLLRTPVAPSQMVTASELSAVSGPWGRAGVVIASVNSSGTSTTITHGIGVSGELALWPFENGVNDTNVIYPLTLAGNASIIADDTPRATGHVYSGTASGDYATTSLTLPDSYTKAAWVYPADISTVKNILSSQSGNTHAFFLDGGTLFAGNDDFHRVSYSGISGTTWTHVAVTYDSSSQTMTLYVNGVAQSAASGVATASGADISIGSLGGSNCFTGRLDDVWVYDRALLESEIQALIR